MGRKVSQRDNYTIYKAKGKTARTKMICGRYASIIRGWNNDGAIRTVYNITVDGEHSYIVNGIAVHNCQGFSVAGKQGGLDDPRSALCLSYCRLLETMRPRWFVWENVPGVFSTNGGEDFKAFIRKIDEIGYSVSWRVLDAQYVRVDGFARAVPQRRRRVFVVGHLGADWRYPASVLFEPGCLPGNTPPRRIKGAGVARSLTASTGGTSGKEQQHTFISGDGRPLNAICRAGDMANSETGVEVGTTLLARQYKSPPFVCAGFCGGQGAKAGGIGYREEVSPTIRASESGSNQVPDILCQYGDIAGALTARHDSSACADRGMSIVYENHAQDSRVKPCGECSPQINAKAGTGGGNLPLVHEVAIAIAENTIGRKENNGGNGTGAQEELAYTQNATGVMGGSVNTTVRRLLPVECERLMGFPDNHTRIPWRGKPAEDCPDSPRYKACGNSMCVNVMRWIGMRIEFVERRMK